MSPLRLLAGLITLAYAAYVMIEGALGVVGMAGPLPIRLVAALGHYMHLASGQPWWRAGFEIAAGFAYAMAGSQLVGSRDSARGLFILAALTDITARWVVTLMIFPTLAALRMLATTDKLLLVVLALGALIYLSFGRIRTPHASQPVLLAE